MKAEKTFDEYRYCGYADIGSVTEGESFWNEELLSVLLILLKRHNVITAKDPSCFDTNSFEERLKAEKIIDEKSVLDLAGIEKIYPLRFRRKVPFKLINIVELVRSSGLCVLEVLCAADGTVHYFACDDVIKDNVMISDCEGKVSDLGEKGTCTSILWFNNLDITDDNAPRDAVAVVNKAVSFLGTVDTPLGSNNVIFNIDFKEGEPITEHDFWCVTFVWDVFRMCGLSHLLCEGEKTNRAIDVLEWGKKSGLLVGPEEIRYGDLMIYNWDGKGTADHIAICITTMPDNGILTIDGCTGELDDAGGHVNYRFRLLEAEEILGVVRPRYQ